jgi:hypothetical protein
MEQQAEPTLERDLRCTICGTALNPPTAAKASACRHRVDSIRFAEFFWDEV